MAVTGHYAHSFCLLVHDKMESSFFSIKTQSFKIFSNLLFVFRPFGDILLIYKMFFNEVGKVMSIDRENKQHEARKI